MSGFVGILNLDGRPVDRLMLRRLTNFLDFRGPDESVTCEDGPLGFGLTLLRLSPEDNSFRPLRADGAFRIAADARIDGRSELIAALRSQGAPLLDGASDSDLILLAYQTWGESCVDRLIGDFSFAIWDGSTKRLFCARDQMGVKPFFYARLGRLLIFSNTLACIRQHPEVSDRLNELSIADFLLFEMIQDTSATAFADIHRLPPAHSLRCEGEALSVRRYWQADIARSVRFPRPSDYLERFTELLDTAVADRLRTSSACIFMSGGLDSPAVAASAKRVSAQQGDSCSLWAFTQVFDKLIPHEERHFAGLVAQALKIPIEYRADDNVRLFEYAERPGYTTPEPIQLAWPELFNDHLRRVSAVSHVVLTGFGADPIFSSRITVHLRDLLKRREWGAAFSDASGYLSAERRLSRLYLRTRLRILLSRKQKHFGFMPDWLNPDFTRRLNLRDRWKHFTPPIASGRAVRPEAHEVTFAPFWPDTFNTYDAGVTGVAVEVRHPFFDLRLMNFLLALPRLPWCCDKELLRQALRGIVPDDVRLRRKSPLQADPAMALLHHADHRQVHRFNPAPGLENFVDLSQMPQTIPIKDTWEPWVHFRPLSLNYWLRHLAPPSINGRGGMDHAASPARQA